MIDIAELQKLPEEKPVQPSDADAFSPAKECTPLSCLYDFTTDL
jgi:hypothetical protein